MNYIIAIGMFQAAIATALLWRNKLKSKADGLLLVLLVCIGAHLAIKFCIYTLISDLQVRYQMNTFIGFCYGPLIYLYTLKEKDGKFIPAGKWYLFLPFVAAMVGYLTVICVLSVSADIGHQVLRVYNNATTYLLGLFNLVCSALAFAGRRSLPAEKQRERQLVGQIAFCLMFFSAAGLVYGFLRKFFIINYDLPFRSLCYMMLSFICIIIVRFKYNGVIMSQPAETPPPPPGSTPAFVDAAMADHDGGQGAYVSDGVSEVHRKAQLTDEEHRLIFEKLELYLAKTKAYTDPELSLDKLAGAIDTSRYHLSETLNAYAHKSFYQYINEWRIGRITEQIRFLAEKDLPVNFLIIAYDNGFKAKSSFNLYFKKLTGQTPSGYLKTLSETMENA